MSKVSYSWKVLSEEKRKEFKDRVEEMKKQVADQPRDLDE